MSTRRLSIFVAKDAYKFSSAHWTVFPDGTKEALHGHNYMVGLEVDLKDAALVDMIDFRLLKRALKPLCDAWDEKIMLPRGNKHVRLSEQGGEVEVHACGKRYVFPTDETVILPCENVSSEQLAAVFADLFAEAIRRDHPNVFALLDGYAITISETAGQGATVRCRIGS